MTTPLDLEIRSRLACVISGETVLGEFYRWFVPATWEVERSQNEEAIRLTHEIAHLLNEFSAGDLTAEEVKRQLLSISGTYVLTSAPWNRPAETPFTTGTSAGATTEPAPRFGFAFGTRLVVVPA